MTGERRASPLFEADLVNIISTPSLAPDCLVLGREIHEADGTSTLQRLALAIVAVIRGAIVLKHAHKGAFIHLAQLLFTRSDDPP